MFAHAAGYVGYDRYMDAVDQQAVSHHLVVDHDAATETTTPFRYVWPFELRVKGHRGPPTSPPGRRG